MLRPGGRSLISPSRVGLVRRRGTPRVEPAGVGVTVVVTTVLWMHAYKLLGAGGAVAARRGDVLDPRRVRGHRSRCAAARTEGHGSGAATGDHRDAEHDQTGASAT